MFIIASKVLVELLYLYIVVTTTNTHECVKIFYKQILPPTCFGQTCDHLQADALEILDTKMHYKVCWSMHKCMFHKLL